MAIEIDKRQPINQTTAAGQQPAVVTANETKQPIDLKNNPEAISADEQLTSFIKSEEFIKMTPEQQIEALKKNFFPASSDTEIQQYLSVARQAIEKENTQPKETETEETAIDIQNTFEVYAQKIGFKGDIDELISLLKTREKDGTIDDEGKELLKQFAAQDAQSNNNDETAITSEQQKPENSEELIPASVRQSEEWRNAPAEVKFAKYMQAFLEKNDSEFAKLNDEDKSNYLDNHIDKYANKLCKGWDKMSEYAKTGQIAKLANTLETISKNSISLDDYIKDPEGSLRKTSSSNKKLIPASVRDSEEWKNKTPEEKAIAYGDAYLTKYDKKYAKLKTPEEKKAYAEKKIKTVLKQLNLDIDNLSPEEQKALATKACVIIDALDQASIDIGNMENVSVTEINDILLKTSEDPQFTKFITTQNDLAKQYYNTKGKEPTYGEFYNYLKELDKQGKLSDEQKIVLNKFEEIEKALPSSKNKKFTIQTSLSQIYGIDQTSLEDGIERDIQKGMSEKSIIKNFKEYGATITPKEGKLIQARMKALGYSDKQIKNVLCNIISTEDAVETSATYKVLGKRAGDVFATGILEAKASNSKGKDAQIAKMAACSLTKSDAKYYKGKEFDLVATEKMQISNDLAQAEAAGMNEYMTEEEVNSHSLTLMSSNDVPDSSKSVFSKSIVETAPTPQRQLSVGKTLSQVDNPAVTEGLAAASNSVDKSVRNEYNKYVETAAKNYPPETQAVIKNAMKTGEISKETLSKTTPPSASDNSQKTQQADSKTTTAKTNNNQNQTTTAKTAAAEKTTQAAVAANPAKTSASIASASVTPAKVQSAQNPINTVSNSATEISGTAQSHTYSTQAETKKDTQIDTANETAQLEQIRQEAAENAKNTSEEIKQSIAEHEAQQEISKAVDEVIDQLNADGNISLSEKQKIKQQLMNAGNITKIYEIISQLGAKELFLDRLINGSSFAINSFLDNVDDESLIEDLYRRCPTDTVKKELLSKLSQDRVHSLLSAGKIQNLGDVDYKVLKSFILKNIGTMHYTDFQMYAQYLPGDDREKLEAQFNELNRIETAQNQQPQTDDKQTTANAAEDETDTQPKPADNNQLKAENKKATRPDKKPTFAANEMQKTLNDGRVIKRKETFAGISDSTDDDSFEDITETAMNDEVLTPGSDAWRQKYGKYEHHNQKTAFTMAALEEDEFTGSYPPQTIPHWKYKGKLNFKG